MKAIKSIIVMALMALVSVVQAQKLITVNDVYNGQTVLQIAKEHAVEAFIATKSIYKNDMTESAFVNACLQNFPKNYSDLREAYVPYAVYLYSFHQRGLTEDQVRKIVTGKEYVDCTNGLIGWRKAHPGEDPMKTPWWKFIIHWAALILTAIDERVN
jgi:hypothetical protein